MKKLSIFILSLLALTAPLISMETDIILKRTPAEVSTQFYKMLKEVDQIFSEAGLTYWAACGTLLGALRHHGMIPWDDDIDLAFFEAELDTLLKLEDRLQEQGLTLVTCRGYYKICSLEGHIPCDENGKPYPWRYPFIDLFPMKQYDDRISYAAQRLFEAFGEKDWYEVGELKRVPFGSRSILIPFGAKDYLERIYGLDVWDVAYVKWDHANERELEMVKVELVTFDCAPDHSD